jgi:hypothetical protein
MQELSQATIALPRYEATDDDSSFELKIYGALALLDTDPASVEIAGEYFRYADHFEGNEVVVDVAN